MATVVVAWSGGKDCAVALDELRGHDDVEIAALLTTVNREHDRSTMHGVRRELHERQAAALDLPIDLVSLPPEPSNETYESTMAEVHEQYRARGVDRVVFADLFLEDVRGYREAQLSGTGLEGWWPLWGRDTADLARAFLDAGFRATVVAADASVVDETAVGVPFDDDFLASLPPTVDPCGEHGEFHTFVWDGPPFETPVPIEVGETVTRAVGDGEFHFADLQLAEGQ